MKYILSLSLAVAVSLSAGAQTKTAPKKPSSTTSAAQTLPKGVKFIEEVKGTAGKVLIPYKKYQLDNGLVIVVHEDKSDPLVHVDVTYHVGSAREEIGKSGFAHFFEHMMFQGSDNVADEEHFKLIQEAGGTLNGTTNRDRTNYFETLPKNYLETALWLEADRMGFLLDAVTQQKFEVQRATVKNERGQRYDNVPYGLAQEVISKNLYPYGHPYSWLTIGYIEDLNRVDVNDLKNFFLRWYGPNNATLTVGGDVNAMEVVALANKYFGSIPRGPEVNSMKLPSPVLEKDRFITHEDNVRMPRLYITFPTVPNRHPDEAAVDCLAEIIGGGPSSILYKNLVKANLAQSAYAYNPTYELAGEFSILVNPYPGKNLKEMHQVVKSSLEEFEKRGVTMDDIKRFQASFEISTVSRLNTVSGKVSTLAANQTFTGNPNFLTIEQKEVAALTPEMVMAAYNKYIKGKNAVVLSVVPKGKLELIADEPNYTVSSEGYKPGKDEYKGLKYNKAKDNFDRSKRPAPTKTPVVQLPTIQKAEMKNGIAVNLVENNELPVVTLALSFEGGRLHELNTPNKAGVANMVAAMLQESTEKYSTEAFADELDKLGSRISVSVGTDVTTVSIYSLTKNLSKTLELAEERLFRPKFDQKEFESVKKRTLESVKNQGIQPTFIANKVAGLLMYGENHLATLPASGSEETIPNITLQDVKDVYAKLFTPQNGKAVVVGDIKLATLMNELARFNKFNAKGITAPQIAQAKQPEKTRIYLVNKDNAPQSEIRVLGKGLPYDALGEYFRSDLMNYPLGGNFNSRINLLLREKRGFTYGARSGFSGNKYYGTFAASSGVRGNATDSAVVDFMETIKEYVAKGIKEEELKSAKMALGQAEALKYESLMEKASFVLEMVRNNLPADFTVKQNEIIQAMTASEINALAKKNIDPNKLNILVVGDKSKVLSGLKATGYEVVELDVNGRPVQN